MKNPLLSVQMNAEKPIFYRVFYSDTQVDEKTGDPTQTGDSVFDAAVGSKLVTGIFRSEPQIPVASLEEAEKIFIDKILQTDATTWKVLPANNEEEKETYSELALLIFKSSYLIAARTRIGAGNTVLMNKEDVFYLKEAPFNPLVISDNNIINEDTGSWAIEGTLNNSITVYSGPVPRGKIVVLYSGIAASNSSRVPAVYSEYNNQKWLTLIENTPETFGNAMDYISVITIEESKNDN